MYIANDKNGERVHIESAKRGLDYFCPICNFPVILKIGPIKAHHYAHAKGFVCLDSWQYDSSNWRFDNINRFGKEYQERIISLESTKHIADVLIDDKTIIEFQQGKLSQKEFNERNIFFKNKGLKAIWLFDVQKDYTEGNLFKVKGEKELYTWKEVNPTLKKYTKLTDDLFLFLQLDNQTIISVDWLSENGISFFGSNCKYTPEDFIKLCSSNSEKLFDRINNKKMYFERLSNNQMQSQTESEDTSLLPLPDNFDELYDKLISFVNTHNYWCYYGCPKNPSHTVSQKECGQNCRSLSTRNGNLNKVCTYRFKESDYRGCQIDRIFRDIEGRITQVNIIKNGLAEFKSYQQYEPVTDDILSIWKKQGDNWDRAEFYNIQRGIKAKVSRNQINKITKYHNLYGDIKYDNSTSDYTNDKVPYYNLKEWVLIYSHKTYYR